MTEYIGLIAGLAQTGASIYSASEQNDQARLAETQRNQQYDKLNALTSDPNKLLQNIMAMKRELSEKEKDMIVRSVTSRMIQAGQGGAPGLIQEAIAEAMASADQQLFQEASQSYLSVLGLPAGVLRGQPAAGVKSTSGVAAGSFDSLAKSIQALLKPKPGLSETTGLPDLPVSAGTSPSDIASGMQSLSSDMADTPSIDTGGAVG